MPPSTPTPLSVGRRLQTGYSVLLCQQNPSAPNSQKFGPILTGIHLQKFACRFLLLIFIILLFGLIGTNPLTEENRSKVIYQTCSLQDLTYSSPPAVQGIQLCSTATAEEHVFRGRIPHTLQTTLEFTAGLDFPAMMSVIGRSPTFSKWMTGAYQSLNKSLRKSPSAKRHEDAVKFAEEEVLPPPPGTNPFVWACAIICSILSVLVILAGLIVLIGYLAFHPHLPGFYVEGGRLNTLLLDLNFALRSEVAIVFSAHNPNSKVDVYYERLRFDLVLRDQTVSSVLIAPFMQSAKNTTAMQFVMSTGTVQLNPDVGEYLSEAIQRNKIDYDLEATVRTRAKFGSITSVKYTLHTKCQLEFSSLPPIGNGTMVVHDCNTWR